MIMLTKSQIIHTETHQIIINHYIIMLTKSQIIHSLFLNYRGDISQNEKKSENAENTKY